MIWCGQSRTTVPKLYDLDFSHASCVWEEGIKCHVGRLHLAARDALQGNCHQVAFNKCYIFELSCYCS